MTSVLGGLRNAETGLHSGQVVYMPGCTTTNCSESDFGAETTAAKAAKLTVLVLGTLGWCDAHTARAPVERVLQYHPISLSRCGCNQQGLMKQSVVRCVRARSCEDRDLLDPGQNPNPNAYEREGAPLNLSSWPVPPLSASTLTS